MKKRGMGSGSEPNPKGDAGNKFVFLERWKARAAKRRAQIADPLQTISIGPEREGNLKLWLKNLETRRMWLEARLEHFKGVEEILKSRLDRQ